MTGFHRVRGSRSRGNIPSLCWKVNAYAVYVYTYNIVSSRSEGKAKLGKDARGDSLSLHDTRVKRRATPGFNERRSIFIVGINYINIDLYDVRCGGERFSRFDQFFSSIGQNRERLYTLFSFLFFAFFLGNYIWNI